MGEKTTGGEDSKLAALCEYMVPFPSAEWPGLSRESNFICGRKRQLATWIKFHSTLARGRPVGMKYPSLCAWGEEFRRLEKLDGVHLKIVNLQRPYWESVASLIDRSQGKKKRFSASPAECRRLQEFLDREKKKFLERRSYLTVRSADLLRDPRAQIDRLIGYLGLHPTGAQVRAAVAHVDPVKAPHARPIRTPADRVAAKCQVLVKSFRRFKPLAALVASVRQYYPTLEMLIADDSHQRETDYPASALRLFRSPNVRTFLMPFDCGLAAGRNWLVQQASAEYVLLADDDFVFDCRTQLERFLDVLESDPKIDAVAGMLKWSGSGIVNWVGELDITLKVRDKIQPRVHGLRSPWRTANGTRYRRTDICWNFFLARREFLLRCPWDPQFKISREHLDWLLSVKQQGGRLAFTPQVIARHIRQTAPGYTAYRHRSNVDLLLAKWNLADLPRHHHTGEKFSPLTVEGDPR